MPKRPIRTIEPKFLPPLGSEPMDRFSTPTAVHETALGGIVFDMPIRANPEKPGRTLEVVWDQRETLVPGFVNNYSYVMRFSEKGNVAGNHFHKKKHEMFRPVIGNFVVFLENPDTQEQEEIPLQEGKHQGLYVPAGIAHTVVSDSDIAALLVLATFPNNAADEFPYKIK